jgi:hypothetical protein
MLKAFVFFKLINLFYFFGTGVRTQVLILARQALYHLKHFASKALYSIPSTTKQTKTTG